MGQRHKVTHVITLADRQTSRCWANTPGFGVLDQVTNERKPIYLFASAEIALRVQKRVIGGLTFANNAQGLVTSQQPNEVRYSPLLGPACEWIHGRQGHWGENFLRRKEIHRNRQMRLQLPVLCPFKLQSTQNFKKLQQTPVGNSQHADNCGFMTMDNPTPTLLAAFHGVAEICDRQVKIVLVNTEPLHMGKGILHIDLAIFESLKPSFTGGQGVSKGNGSHNLLSLV